jgi:hypothetical protein
MRRESTYLDRDIVSAARGVREFEDQLLRVFENGWTSIRSV